jgi:hypothetical protein
MNTDQVIAQIVDRHVAAFKRGDVPALVADYADDAVVVTKPTGVVRGKDSIGRTYASILKDVFPPDQPCSTLMRPLLPGRLHYCIGVRRRPLCSRSVHSTLLWYAMGK